MALIAITESGPFSRLFNGPLGDGRHGAFNITGATTATEVVYQASDFTIDNATYTVKQQNPGGIFIACTGRFKMTSGAILDLNGVGGLGGAGGAADPQAGKDGQFGRGLGGVGGGGGGNGTQQGGGGMETLFMPSGIPIGFKEPYNTTGGPISNQTGAPAISDISGWGAMRIATTSVSRGTGTGGAGTAPSSTLLTPFFDLMIASGLWDYLGFGSGGGGGARTNTTNGGLGGHAGGLGIIVCNEFEFLSGATIRANGLVGASPGSGAAAGGGGGGGGVFGVFYRTLITNAGSITTNGGAAGTGIGGPNNGGAGGNGYNSAGLYRW